MGYVYDTIVIGDDRYEFPAGRRNFRRAMGDYFPGEQYAIDEYMALVRRCAKTSLMYFADKALPRRLSAVIGPVLRFPSMRFARRTTAEVLDELTDNRRLKAVLTGQYGDYGLPPSQSSFFMHALVVNHYMSGGAYPVGGASRIAETILPLIERTGGEVITSAGVEQILIDGNRAVGVRLADGSEHRAPIVISNAGVANTLGRLIEPTVAARHGFTRELASVEPSVAHASLYLGFRATAADLGLAKSNLWVYPHDDHERAMADFVADPNAPLPVAYLSFPSAKDPAFERRYPGRATVEVVTLAPYERFARWSQTRWGKRGEEYNQIKQELSDKMLGALYSQCPQLEGKVDHCEMSSPLSTRHFANFHHGEIYGISHTPARFAQRWLRPQTPIRGLYMTGADVCSAGVGSALFAGVLTASSVLSKNLL
ncbi:MAG: NAD(P)/FAD-dependent oxidoreductase, partial [Myxococcota bacterium]